MKRSELQQHLYFELGLPLTPVYFCRVMKRVITLINQLASVSGSTAALQAQAENANQAVKKYMDDNNQLKKVCSTLG